jgi:hypothetical protein
VSKLFGTRQPLLQAIVPEGFSTGFSYVYQSTADSVKQEFQAELTNLQKRGLLYSTGEILFHFYIYSILTH